MQIYGNINEATNREEYMEFKKTMSLTLKDYRDLNYFVAYKRIILVPIIAVISLTVAILLIGIIALGEDWAIVFDTQVFICYAVLILIPFVSLFSLRTISKKQYESSKMMKSETELTINEAGVSEISKFGNVSFTWEDIFKARESKTAFYVFISKLQTFIIPKRFITAEEDSVIRALISNHLIPTKNKLIR
jgi:hypothetical protein